MDHYYKNNQVGEEDNNKNKNKNKPMRNEITRGNQEQQQHQQLTIFYGGQICVCDVTELQAKEIIWRAVKDMKETRQTMMESSSSLQPGYPCLRPPSIDVQSPQGLSMKKSLQLFLEKRRRLRNA